MWISCLRAPADMEKPLQFFPPQEIGGSIALAQLTLLPAEIKAPAAELLRPVVIERKLKPAVPPSCRIAVPPYRVANLLLNGIFDSLASGSAPCSTGNTAISWMIRHQSIALFDG